MKAGLLLPQTAPERVGGGQLLRPSPFVHGKAFFDLASVGSINR